MAEPIDAAELDDFFNYALKLHKNADFIEAEKCYKQLLQVKPNWPDVQHLLGILLGQLGRYDEALVLVKAAVENQKDSATFHNSLGNIYRHLNQLDLAISHFQIALKLQPDSTSVNNNLGILFQKQNQLNEAIKFYEAAIKIKPDYADAHFNLSTVYTQQQKFEEAINHLKIALQHQPEHLQAHAHIGQLYLRKDQLDAAIFHYRQRLKFDPDHVESHHQLAIAWTKLADYEQAIEEYKKALRLQPNHIEALHNLGSLYMTQRRPDLALQYFLQLLSVQPDLDAYYNLGVIYSYQDRHQDAIHFLNECLKMEPKFYNALVNLGAVYLKIDDLAQAASYYEQALALKPKDPELLYILAAINQKSAPQTTPKEYISHLFDEYASHFDKHLIDYLDYQVPQLLFNAVSEIENSQRLKILDLGCGTGLCGEKLRPLAQQLIGVDLSEKMLEVAKAKQIYDELLNLDVVEALSKFQELDLIVAGDVFGYVGDLQEIFLRANAALKKAALFAFTVETTTEPNFVLQSNARFAHNPNYIENLSAQNNFQIIKNDSVILRMQKNQPVAGYLFLLRKM